jgi:hypothetical protein
MNKIILLGLIIASLFIFGCNNNTLINECIGCCQNNPEMNHDYCEEFCTSHINEGNPSERKGFVDMICKRE